MKIMKQDKRFLYKFIALSKTLRGEEGKDLDVSARKVMSSYSHLAIAKLRSSGQVV
jgi:hypothetical protein